MDDEVVDLQNLRHVHGYITTDEPTEVFVPRPLITYKEALDKRNRQQQEFNGLSKEELILFDDDPYWSKFRKYLFCVSCATYLLLYILAGACLITAPKCPKIPKLLWWQQKPIYQVEVKSIIDTDADGYGDINGVISAIDYIEQLGFGSIKFHSSFFQSQSHKPVFGVTNFTQIDSVVGTIQQFDTLVDRLHKKGMHIILDFPLFATSREHHWYKAAIHPKHVNHKSCANMYVNASDPSYMRNSWKGTFDTGTNEAAIITEHQMLLDVADSKTCSELLGAIRYWLLDKHVDGFNFYAFYKFNDVENDKLTKEMMHFLIKIRELIDDVAARTMTKRVMMITLMKEDPTPLDLFFTYEKRNVAHMVVPNIFYTEKTLRFPNNKKLANRIRHWLFNCQYKNWLGWQMSSPYTPRISSITEDVALMYPFNLLITGTPIFMYGDEIPLLNIYDDVDLELPGPVWAYSSLIPMQWDRTKNAAFSKSKKLWLPIASNFQNHNIKRLTASGIVDSPLRKIKRLLMIRQYPSVLFGKVIRFESDGDVFYWAIEEAGFSGYAVIVNFAKHGVHIAMRIAEALPELKVRYSSNKAFTVNTTIDIHNVIIPEKSIILVEWPVRQPA
ncbi:hypothetical protein GJ496_003312 [Pomphorhynchus laevis]|nr:hypothetical protein GJ496_003312 [Pomphorhynchus laevis]